MIDRSQPWSRGAYKRFGIKFGGTVNRKANDQTHGWTVIAIDPKIRKTGSVKTDDPFAALIAMAQKAMKNGASGVDLYRYRTAAIFANSRAAAEGLTHAEHETKITMAAAALRELNIPVNILIVEE
jgi:hypothetical protein